MKFDFWETAYNIFPGINEDTLEDVYNYCVDHPDCGGCDFYIDKKGCYWRQGKTPREWDKVLEDHK